MTLISFNIIFLLLLVRDRKQLECFSSFSSKIFWLTSFRSIFCLFFFHGFVYCYISTYIFGGNNLRKKGMMKCNEKIRLNTDKLKEKNYKCINKYWILFTYDLKLRNVSVNFRLYFWQFVLLMNTAYARGIQHRI